MKQPIVKYQKAFNTIVNKLKQKDEVLAVMVFGSMVSGDLWDESDIDLFVVTEKEPDVMQNIYVDEKEVPIHVKLMSKIAFLQMHESNVIGGFIHRVFASSRLVFSKDEEITERYNNGRYYPDLDREVWNIVYLSRMLKNISLCKKYLSSKRILTAYSISVSCAEDYARLFINNSGHMISKDALTVAANLSDRFKECVEKLFYTRDDMESAIENCIEFINDEIDLNIKSFASVLIEFVRNRNILLSSEEIKSNTLFQSYDIDMEEVLSALWKKNIIKKDFRDYKLTDGSTIIKENVYYI